MTNLCNEQIYTFIFFKLLRVGEEGGNPTHLYVWRGGGGGNDFTTVNKVGSKDLRFPQMSSLCSQNNKLLNI